MTFAVRELKEYSVRKVCKLLKLNKSTYYNWLKRIPENKYTEEEKSNVERVFLKHNGSFGRRIIKKELQKEAINYSENKISRILKQLEYKSKYGRKKCKNVYTSKNTEERYTHENVYNWLPEYFRSNMNIWSTDFTEVELCGKKIYICGIVSVNGKTLVSYKMSGRCTSELAAQTLEQAIAKYGVPDIVMSDRGSQFTSKAFHELIKKYEIIHSMSRPRTPIDNRFIETFWKSMKTEIGKISHLSIAQYCLLIEYYINYYNTMRPHSTLNYLTPLQYAQQNNFVI